MPSIDQVDNVPMICGPYFRGATFIVRRATRLSLAPTPKHLGDAPRLCHATPRRVWRFGIEDLADGSETRVLGAKLSYASSEEFARAVEIVRMDSEPRVDKRSDQPRPNGTLVIRRVAGTQIAKVFALVIGVIRRQRPQSYRGHKFVARDTNDGLPAAKKASDF